MKPVYEGKAKRVYDAGGGLLVVEFKDEVTAGDGARRDKAPGKGELAAKTSALLFREVAGVVKTHFVEYKPPNSLVVRRLDMIPLEVIVRFYAYGSFLRRMPLAPRLKKFSKPIVEFHLKDDKLHDPLVLAEDAVEAGLASEGEIAEMKGLALAYEISGDTMRVLYRGEHLDKEYYRQTGDVAGLLERYRSLLSLIEGG
jgi:phosphoribosylaminoimidazole-succinocarboxamide synthase